MGDLFSIGDRSWLWGAAIVYGCSFLYGCGALLRGRRPVRYRLFTLIAIGFVLQTIGLYLRGLKIDSCPLGNTFEIIQFITWSLILLYLIFEPVFEMSLLGFFSSAFATVLALLSLLFPSWDLGRGANIFGPNVWIELHAALAIFSYGIFGILAVTSVMYVIQIRSLRKRRLKGYIRPFLPSIVQLDHLTKRLLTSGIVLLTFSLFLGSIYWFRNLESVNWSKLIVTVGIWIAYLLLGGLRWRRKVVAQRLAWTCILLFVITLVSVWPVTGSPRLPAIQTSLNLL